LGDNRSGTSGIAKKLAKLGVDVFVAPVHQELRIIFLAAMRHRQFRLLA
jgi:hypothetical protein